MVRVFYLHAKKESREKKEKKKKKRVHYWDW
jgi:hypothetical protein